MSYSTVAALVANTAVPASVTIPTSIVVPVVTIAIWAYQSPITFAIVTKTAKLGVKTTSYIAKGAYKIFIDPDCDAM